MHVEEVTILLKEAAVNKPLVEAAVSRLSQIPGIKRIEQVFPNVKEVLLAKIFTAKVESDKLHSSLKKLIADPDVFSAYTAKVKKTL